MQRFDLKNYFLLWFKKCIYIQNYLKVKGVVHEREAQRRI